MRTARLIALTGLLLLTAGCVFQGEPSVAKHPRKFDSQLWKSAGARDARCDMVDDLRNRIGLIGKTRTELVALLGKPESDGQGADHYHLCPSFMDVWILELQWENGRVYATRIHDT